MKHITKPKFNLSELLSIAEELKYVKGVKEEICQELTDPSDWLVREMAQRVHSARRIGPQILDSFRPIVTSAIQSYMADRINETLDKASKIVEVKEHDHKLESQDIEEVEDLNEIITTQEEKESLCIVRAIRSSLIDPDRVIEKNTKTYCNITLDGQARKSFLRLHFNSLKKKKITIFDQDQPQVVPVSTPSDLYQHKERIRKALMLKLEGKQADNPESQD